MATLHNGRRPALIPSIESLSPEEVRDVFCNRIGRPFIPPPNPNLAVSASQGQLDRQETRRMHRFPQPPIEASSKTDSTRSLSERPDAELEWMAPSSTHSRANTDISVRWTQAEEDDPRDRLWKPDTITLGRESKRKHAVFAQDEPRRHSNEIWEDIPHMNEIESTHAFRTNAKDVFGLKGQKSLFEEVCSHSSVKRPRQLYMLTNADRTVIQSRRGYSHPTQQGAQLDRHLTSRYIRLEPTFLELLTTFTARHPLGKMAALVHPASSPVYSAGL